MSQASSFPIPVNIITGALGAGKTTAIARLLADKPAQEYWLVILNEFTDTGIDALTLAAAARGAYDVRMIPGGCLCCTGEEDFRRQLSGILALPAEQRPVRILIEPSGIGHPGAVVEELRVFERSGAIRLCSTIALLDGLRGWLNLDQVAQAQVDAADVLLLSKAELVTELEREQFLQWAQQQYPVRRFVACVEHGMLPKPALSPPPVGFSFEMPVRVALHERARVLASQRPSAHLQHDHSAEVVARQIQWGNLLVQARSHRLLGREACGWIIPSSVLFDLARLQDLLEIEDNWPGVERFKAVLRTGVDRWHLLQRWQQRHALAECNWSQDSRIEIQLAMGASANWSAWDRRWQALSEPCPVG